MKNVNSCELRYEEVDSDYLDCVNDNLAVLLIHNGIADVRTPFACQWHFDFKGDERDGIVLLEKTPIDEMIRRQTGCVVQRMEFDGPDYVAVCTDHLRHDRPVVVFGDAYFMPWLPYFCREHMEHSFIIDGVSDDQWVHIVDAYYNRTEWGVAAPVDLCLPATALAPMIQKLESANNKGYIILKKEGAGESLDLEAALRSNAKEILLQLESKARLLAFADHYEERVRDPVALKRFVLACWLISRNRALHARWLETITSNHPGPARSEFVRMFEQDVAKPWQRVSEFSYILLRRVVQGRAPAMNCFQMLKQTINSNEIWAAKALVETDFFVGQCG